MKKKEEGTALILSDMNNDGILNILDIIGIVNVILDY